MKFKKIIAIATAAAFALTGTSYAETGADPVAEGNDVSQVIEDISLTGERIETNESSYYTGDMTVNFSLYDEAGISSVAILVNGRTIAEKSYDTTGSIVTDDGEVMNADSTVETDGSDAEANTASPVTAISDSLVISADDISALAEADTEAKATEPQQEEPAAEETTEPAAEETAEPAAEEATEPAVEETAEPQAEATETEGEETAGDPAEEPADEAVEEPTAEEVTEPAVEEAVEPAAEESAEPQAEASETEVEETAEEPASEEVTEPVSEEVTEPAAEESIVSTYSAEMVVTDVNGQTETKSFELNTAIAETQAEKQEAVAELKAMDLGEVEVIDGTTYRIEVNLTRQAVTFYKKTPEGDYSPFKVVVCSSGRSGSATPTGTFTIGPYKKKCARSKWALLSGGSCFAQFMVRIQHGICFHSVPYKVRGDNSKMYRSQYNKLGSVASQGCVRLRVVDAKWIYDNCPNGTVVRIYKSSTASPLGVPKYTKLGKGGTYSWDPTDPDIGNPFNGGDGIATGLYPDSGVSLPVAKVDKNIKKHTVILFR